MTETVPERIERRRRERLARAAERAADKARRGTERATLTETIIQRTSTTLAQHSDEALLDELLKRNKLQAAPRTIALAAGAQVATIGIGKDHTATVIIFDEDREALNDLAG